MRKLAALLSVAGLALGGCGTTGNADISKYSCKQGGPFGSCLRYELKAAADTAAPSGNHFPGTSGTMGNTLGNGTFR
jgi:hypothetical protein